MRITFIAPYAEILSFGQRVIEELGLAGKVDCFVGSLKAGVDIAREAERNEADVIVSRGGTAELIHKSEVQVPVVEIPITFQDLAEALLRAKTMTGQKNPKIAVMAFQNMIRSIEVFAKVMELQLMIYQLDTDEDIPAYVARAARDKADVLIGGKSTVALAEELGMRTILLSSCKESFRTAFLQAEKVSYARQLEKERMQKFRVLVDYSTQGIININQDKIIDVFNYTAERLLNCNAADVIGKNVEEVCPSIGVDACLSEGKALRGELLKVDNRKLMVNIIPITIHTTVTGAMITLEDTGHIVEMEARIRKEIYSKGLTAEYQLSDILGISPAITEAKRIAREYAGIDATVMIIGASGTGKELFAQSIHNASKRRQRPFVAVNCGAIPANLLESELFGYVEGAFTGATKKGKAGFFELAHGGTIFLDEIGEMDKVAQTSLLRVIQERRVKRLGDDKYLPVDVRIIAATNKNLLQLVKDGLFREDLYYRINVLPLVLPVLQNRTGDAAVIAQHFIQIYNQRFGRKVLLSDKAKACIERYSWPGNIRQLRNVVERLVVTARSGEVPPEVVESMLESPMPVVVLHTAGSEIEYDSLSEKDKILRVLSEVGYSQKEAAKRLEIDRSTLYRKLKKYNIKVNKTCKT